MRIRDAVEHQGFDVRWAVDAADAQAVLRTEAGLTAALIAWELPDHDAGGEGPAGPGCCARSAGASVTCRSSWS